MSSTATDAITASRADTGPATTVVVIESARGAGRVDLVSAVVAHQGRGLMAVYRADDLDAEGRAELRAAATPEGVELGACSLAAARGLLARGLVMARIARRPVPPWITVAGPLIGDLDALSREFDDIYHCAGCGAPLAPALQLAAGRARGAAALVLDCPACQPGAPAVSGPDAAIAHAWLAHYAGDPRKALVHAARAEGRRVPPEQLDGVRGAALLALANPVEATAHLRRAVAHDPSDRELRSLLAQALARAGYFASATAELEHLGRVRPELAPRAAAVRGAIAAVTERGPAAGRGRWLEGALAAFAAAC